ncbi:MFS transporter [Streptomyces sp. NPDC054956]
MGSRVGVGAEGFGLEETPLWAVRGFRGFWLSRVVSGLGSAVSSVALPVLVYQESGSPVLVSVVAAAGTLPYLVFGLVAGAVADRVDRRRLMVGADWANALCLLSVPVAWVLGVLSVVHVVAAALVSSSLALFFDAAVYGFVPSVVGKENLARANSALYGGETVVRIVGTAVAGGLIVLVRPAGSLVVDAVSFAVAALLLRAVVGAGGDPLPTGAAGRVGFRESVSEGLSFLWNHPALRVMTAVGTLQSFAGGAIVGQLVVFADRGLGIPAADFRTGLLYAAWSAGGIGGSLVLPRLAERFDAFGILRGVLPVGALLGLVVVLARDWRVVLVALAAWGCAYLVVLVNTMTYSQAVTPAGLQGRVNTTRRMLSSGVGVPLGALVGSSVTVRFGVQAGMSTAVLSVGTAAVLVWAVRRR